MQVFGHVGSLISQEWKFLDKSEASICRNGSCWTRRKLQFAGMEVFGHVGSFNLQESKFLIVPTVSVTAIKLSRHTGMDAGIQAMDGNYQMA